MQYLTSVKQNRLLLVKEGNSLKIVRIFHLTWFLLYILHKYLRDKKNFWKEKKYLFGWKTVFFLMDDLYTWMLQLWWCSVVDSLSLDGTICVRYHFNFATTITLDLGNTIKISIYFFPLKICFLNTHKA